MPWCYGQGEQKERSRTEAWALLRELKVKVARLVFPRSLAASWHGKYWWGPDGRGIQRRFSPILWGASEPVPQGAPQEAGLACNLEGSAAPGDDTASTQRSQGGCSPRRWWSLCLGDYIHFLCCVTYYPKLGTLTQHPFITSQFCRSEVQVAWLGSLRGISWGWNQGVGLAGFQLEALKWGRIHFQDHWGCRQNSGLCSCRTELSILLSAGDRSQLLEAAFSSYPGVPFHLPASSTATTWRHSLLLKACLIRSGPLASSPYPEVNCAVSHIHDVTSSQSQIHHIQSRGDAGLVYQGVERSQGMF